MCGGNKGQSQQSQTSTYTPDPRAAGYITNALDRASATANLPFNVPVAPVAGFSPQQQQAFSAVGNAQGMAQPYFDQAAGLYNQGASGSNISNFFNPFASAVTDNLKDIFGSQMSQTTGNLTQQAGGVGADRIAVGQSELAKQQGLAAGQMLASLYQPALQAAQSAAFNGAQGLANIGQGSQNAALQGANALLGTGGLQQQLAQAQMNAPYQQQIAQAAFPYQQAQFLGSMVGALAPGLGGTTNGQTTSTPAQPSIWSQILGGGAALAGGLGQSGAFGNNGWLTGVTSPQTGATYGGYGSGTNGYGSYGGIQYPAFAKGGAVSDEPIDIAANPFIPQSPLTPIKPNVPQLQPMQQSGGSGGGLGDLIGSVMKVVPFFLQSGGRVNPFANGGVARDDPFGDENRLAGYELLRRGLGTRAPDSIPGGEPAPGEEPIRLAGPEAMQAWRDGTDATDALALSEERAASPVLATPRAAPTASAMAERPSAAIGLSPERAPARGGLAENPWAALTAAGLGIMGGTSPFAGVNIGQGAMQGLKMLQQQKENAQKDESIALAVKRLEQEVQQSQLQRSTMTPYQKKSLELREREIEAEANKPVKPKMLPSGLQKDLGEKATTFGQLSSLEAGFKPDFAGYGSAGAGDLANWAARQFNVGNTDAADWWQTYQAYKNEVRHKLFGAALTATETAQWERSDINPGMAPDRIQANIKRQKEIVEGALRRRANSLVKQGYAADVIEAETGMDLSAKPKAETSTPKFTGRTASDKSGNKLRETADGQWVP